MLQYVFATAALIVGMMLVSSLQDVAYEIRMFRQQLTDPFLNRRLRREQRERDDDMEEADWWKRGDPPPS